MTIDELLAEARAHLERVSPAAAFEAAQSGDAVIVDIREAERRARDGRVPGAVEIERMVLEWRCDPLSEWRDERVSDPALRVVLMCNEGYQSSLAAATLHRLGLPRATDMEDGFAGWRAAGLPIEEA